MLEISNSSTKRSWPTSRPLMRLLLLRLSALGDIVHSLGAVRALAEARPDLELHYLVQSEFAALFAGLDFVSSVIPHERRMGMTGYLRSARRTRALEPAIAVDLQGNWKSAGLARLSRAPRRIGSPRGERREPSSAMLLNEYAEESTPAHPASQAEALLSILAPGLKAGPPRVVASPAELAREGDALQELGIDPQRPFRVMVCSDPADPRAWPLGSMQREAQSAEIPVLWLLGPAESALNLPGDARLLRHQGGELRRLVALAVLVAAAGGEVLGPDRGATHVLSAGGARSHVLFGPQDPALTAPPAAIPLVKKSNPDCSPCRRRSCDHPEGPICMDFTLAEAMVKRGQMDESG